MGVANSFGSLVVDDDGCRSSALGVVGGQLAVAVVASLVIGLSLVPIVHLMQHCDGPVAGRHAEWK